MAEEFDRLIKGQAIGNEYALYNGDSAEVLKTLPADSVHYSIFSPPFQSLYVYSNSDRDLGNCRTPEEFYEQFEFIGGELYRVLMPGRLMSVHCMNLPTSKERDGFIGIRDFRGELIRFFQGVGFIYHSEVCIWKDPVTAMQRTKALGQLHEQAGHTGLPGDVPETGRQSRMRNAHERNLPGAGVAEIREPGLDGHQSERYAAIQERKRGKGRAAYLPAAAARDSTRD